MWPWHDYTHLPQKVAHVSLTQPSLNVYKSDYMSYQKVCECFNIFTGSINFCISFLMKNYGHMGFIVDLLCFCSVLCLLCLCARLLICALWSPAGKGLTSWLSFVVSTVSLSLSHWYPGSGVVLDCIDS